MKKTEDYLYIDSSNASESSKQSRFKIPKTSKIDNLINENRYDEALDLIEKTLKKDDLDYWTLKAAILDNQKEYEKSIECYDNALKLSDKEEIHTDKANALYRWAKITYFPELEYEKAYKLISAAIDMLPQNEDPSEFYFLKGEILEALHEPIEAKKAYLIAYKEFDKLKEFESQVEYLKTTNDTLINISGSYFYNFTPEENLIINLVKEEDNEHDPDAIAAYLNGQKIGYVANSDYTLIDEVKSASKIKNLIKDGSQAKILFIYLDEYIIAKLL